MPAASRESTDYPLSRIPMMLGRYHKQIKTITQRNTKKGIYRAKEAPHDVTINIHINSHKLEDKHTQ